MRFHWKFDVAFLSTTYCLRPWALKIRANTRRELRVQSLIGSIAFLGIFIVSYWTQSKICVKLFGIGSGIYFKINNNRKVFCKKNHQTNLLWTEERDAQVHTRQSFSTRDNTQLNSICISKYILIAQMKLLAKISI